MSNQYEVKVTAAASIDKVLGRFPEITSCIEGGVLFRPLPVEVPSIDFAGYKERAGSASPSEPVRKPGGMKR